MRKRRRTGSGTANYDSIHRKRGVQKSRTGQTRAAASLRRDDQSRRVRVVRLPYGKTRRANADEDRDPRSKRARQVLARPRDRGDQLQQQSPERKATTARRLRRTRLSSALVPVVRGDARRKDGQTKTRCEARRARRRAILASVPGLGGVNGVRKYKEHGSC